MQVYRTGRPALDLNMLRLGGKPALSLSREQVYAALAMRGIPGINNCMGRQELLECYGYYLAECERNDDGPEAA
jgi:hypothetical protein